MPNIQLLLCTLYAIIFAIAASNLGIISSLLAFVYAPDNEDKQVYILVSKHPTVVSPIDIVPGWVLVGSYWFTLAVSVVSVLDSPLMLFILLRQRCQPQSPAAEQEKPNLDSKTRYFNFLQAWTFPDIPFFSALALLFFTTLNIIIGTTALAWIIDQNRGIRGSDSDWSSDTGTLAPQLQYDSSSGYTIGAFSCALIEASVETDVNLNQICRTGKVPSRLLIAYVVLHSVALLLILLPQVLRSSINVDPWKRTAATDGMSVEAVPGKELESQPGAEGDQA